MVFIILSLQSELFCLGFLKIYCLIANYAYGSLKMNEKSIWCRLHIKDLFHKVLGGYFIDNKLLIFKKTKKHQNFNLKGGKS